MSLWQNHPFLSQFNSLTSANSIIRELILTFIYSSSSLTCFFYSVFFFFYSCLNRRQSGLPSYYLKSAFAEVSASVEWENEKSRSPERERCLRPTRAKTRYVDRAERACPTGVNDGEKRAVSVTVGEPHQYLTLTHELKTKTNIRHTICIIGHRPEYPNSFETEKKKKPNKYRKNKKRTLG